MVNVYVVLSAKLTGVSQLVGLLSAPLFGFWADRYQQYNVFLLLAAFFGLFGYFWLANLKSPEVSGENGSRWIYFIMALLGMSQIGAIICSLGIFNRCVLGLQKDGEGLEIEPVDDQLSDPQDSQNTDSATGDEGTQESMPLLMNSSRLHDLHYLKGSIAGVYSLSGGVGILLLTKLGGFLFDTNTSAPFMMLSLFNALLLVAGLLCGVITTRRCKAAQDTIG